MQTDSARKSFRLIHIKFQDPEAIIFDWFFLQNMDLRELYPTLAFGKPRSSSYVEHSICIFEYRNT